MSLPTAPKARKDVPLARGLLDYFPDACAEVAHVSFVANEQHNPGEPMHWAKEKSTDEADCLVRHLLERGTIDTDGLRHTAKVAWRALALLQREIEADIAPRAPRRVVSSTEYCLLNISSHVHCDGTPCSKHFQPSLHVHCDGSTT